MSDDDPISVLNGHCLLEILKHVSLLDLANFKKSYRSLDEIADMDFTRRTHGTLHFYNGETIGEALQIIEQFGSSVNDLRFEFKTLNGWTWSDILSVVHEHCSETLKRFSLIGDAVGLIKDVDIALIGSNLRAMETLKLINWNKARRWPKDFIEILARCECVQHVDIVSLSGIDDVPATIFHRNTNLRTLQWFGPVNGDGLKTIVDSLMNTRLERLILQSTELTPNLNESLLHFHRLSHLKSLCIDCNRVDIGPLLQNLHSCKLLDDLGLCDARLDDSNVDTLGRMTQLKTLKLDVNCFLATRSQLESVAVLCANANLDSVEVLFCERTIDRKNYLSIVEKRKVSSAVAGKCLSLIVPHAVYTASLREIPNDVLDANKKTIKLIDEHDIYIRIG